MAADITALKKPLFWVKEARQSNAEIDVLIQYKHLVIPVEVKAGKTGTLRSLHSYIDQSKAKIAVRLYSGKLEVTETATPNGTPYKLLNLPYFLASKIPQYLEWMEERLLRQ
jgi:hypothetical protein